MAISVLETSKVAVTATAASITSGTAAIYLITANRDCHVKVGSDATVDDFYLPLDTSQSFSVPAGDDLSVIAATGETDGSAWISKVVNA